MKRDQMSGLTSCMWAEIDVVGKPHNERCISLWDALMLITVDSRCGRSSDEWCHQSPAQDGLQLSVCHLSLVLCLSSFSTLSTFHRVSQLIGWWFSQTCKQQQPSVSIDFNNSSMLVPLFDKNPERGQQALLCWRRGNHSAARVSMHIHASPPHRLTATTLQWEMGEMV